MRAKRQWIIGAALFALLIMAASFPMRLALRWADAQQSGFTARAIEGSIWSATIHDARIGAVPLGDLDAWLAPGALLGGRTEIGFLRQDERLGELSGRLRAGSVRGVTDVTGGFPVYSEFGPVPIDTVRLENVEALFDAQGRCRSAHGRVQVMIGGSIAGLDLSQGFGGALSCQGDRAVAALSSQSGMEKLVLGFDGSGAYQARLAIRVDHDAAMAAALAALGFRIASDGFAMALSGKY